MRERRLKERYGKSSRDKRKEEVNIKKKTGMNCRK
jgi:hypothetical protein